MSTTITTAVIMAAGIGIRFGNYTKKVPKGFIEIGGIPMIIRSIETLLECGILRILIGTGYKKEFYELLMTKYPQIECCYSPRYAETNSMFTLYNMRTLIGNDDFLLLESDLIYEKKAIISLLESEYKSAMLISPVIKFQDQYYVEKDEKNVLVNCSTEKNKINSSGELVGIHKLNNVFYQLMCKEYSKILEKKPKLGYEYQLLSISQHIMPMYVLKINKLKWYEIDDEHDLKYAEEYIIY